jgi:hypothetical protein
MYQVCICWCHELLMTSVYYILVCAWLQNFAFIPGFSRYTTIPPSVLSCADWWYISSNWQWCKKTFCKCEILLKCACFLPVYTHHDTCFTMWVTGVMFSSFCQIILWCIYFTTIEKHGLIVGRTRYMSQFEEQWLWKCDVMPCSLLDRPKHLGGIYFLIIRVDV